MNGFTEDIIFGLARDIEKNWEKHNGDIAYFVDMVNRTPYIKPDDLDRFLQEYGDTCHEGVNNVFAAIVYKDAINKDDMAAEKNVRYRFESFLYPAQVSRIELESGTEDWATIRRRQHELAKSRNETIMLYVYNDYRHRWDYINKVLPSGEMYNWKGSGPFYLSPDASSYSKKGGER